MENRKTKAEGTEHMGLMEKVRWRKYNQRNDLLVMACDKVASREYAQEKIGLKYILPYRVFNPGDKWQTWISAIAKHTAASGKNIILSLGMTQNNIPEKWFQNIYGQKKGEWGYSQVTPRILVEPLLENEPNVYRLDCFHGVPKTVQIYRYENHDVKDITTYLLDDLKDPLPIKYNKRKIGQEKIDSRIEEIIYISKKLSEEWDYIRIDFMVHDTGLVFSEFTPYPMSGNGIINPAEFDEYLGGLWHLDGLNQKII
jgi:hypothetical protein